MVMKASSSNSMNQLDTSRLQSMAIPTWCRVSCQGAESEAGVWLSLDAVGVWEPEVPAAEPVDLYPYTEEEVVCVHSAGGGEGEDDNYPEDDDEGDEEDEKVLHWHCRCLPQEGKGNLEIVFDGGPAFSAASATTRGWPSALMLSPPTWRLFYPGGPSAATLWHLSPVSGMSPVVPVWEYLAGR